MISAVDLDTEIEIDLVTSPSRYNLVKLKPQRIFELGAPPPESKSVEFSICTERGAEVLGRPVYGTFPKKSGRYTLIGI